VTSNGLEHTVAYDNAGNESGYFATRTYSPRNLMNAVIDTAGEGPAHQINYGYDYRGVRVSRTETPTDAGSASRYFFYTPELQLLASTVDDSNNAWGQSTHHIATSPDLAMNREIIWFAGAPVAEIGPPRTPDDVTIYSRHRTFDTGTATNTFYTFTDHLGTPLIQTDPTTAIVWRAEYEPYGNAWLMRKGARTDQPLRFPGQELAMTWEGTEENYNVFRWYRAAWGRYTTSDPLSLNGGMNLYRYAGDDPEAFSDPYGLVSWSKNAPVYHAANWDTVFKNCGDWKAHGCTRPFIHFDCNCSCSGNGFFASVELSMSIDVWARDDDPKASLIQIMNEETKHVWYLEAAFKFALKRGENLEAKRFSSKGACDQACKNFNTATYDDFSQFGNWVHTNNPHPHM
jgi:RHS repeat-associated protein